jgi:hypothetical protein
LNPIQRHLAYDNIWGGNDWYIKPEAAASVGRLDAMTCGVNRRDFPTPEAAILEFDNYKGNPDAKNG